MATSGNFTTPNVGGIGSNYPHNAKFSWSQSSQSVSGNYTDISWKFVLGGGTSSASSIGVYNGSVTVNGERITFDFGGSLKKNGTVLASGTKRIWHNNDGKKSFSASGTVNLYWSSGHAVTGSGSWSLNTIARKVNINSVSGSITDDDFSPLVKWTNNGNRVDLKLELPDYGVNPFKLWTNVQGSSSFKPTLTASEMDGLRQRMANTNTTRMRFTVLTMINGKEAFFSYIDKTFTIVNANPTVPTFYRADSNSTTTAVTGNQEILIQNESILHVWNDDGKKAQPKKFASIVRYIISCAGKSQTVDFGSGRYNVSLGQINATTEQSVTVQAIDSRGNTGSFTRTIPVLPYSAPVINLSVARKNNFENETTVKIGGSYTTISGKNTINATTGVQYRYKDASTTNWTAWTSKTATFDNGNFTVAPFVISLDNNKSFNFEAKVTDRLKTTTVAGTLNRGIPIFRISTVDSKCYNNEKRMLVAGDNISDLKNNAGYTDGKKLLSWDRRDTNDPPSYYYFNRTASCLIVEFKQPSKIGLSGIIGGGFCQLETHIPWTDSSGGRPYQIVGNANNNSPMAWRKATSDDAWGAWQVIADDRNSGRMKIVDKTVAMGYRSNFTFSRCMNMVYISQEVQLGSTIDYASYAWQDITETMPVGFRPHKEITFRIMKHNSGTDICMWQIRPNGTMRLSRTGSMNSAWTTVQAFWFTKDAFPE